MIKTTHAEDAMHMVFWTLGVWSKAIWIKWPGLCKQTSPWISITKTDLAPRALSKTETNTDISPFVWWQITHMGPSHHDLSQLKIARSTSSLLTVILPIPTCGFINALLTIKISCISMFLTKELTLEQTIIKQRAQSVVISFPVCSIVQKQQNWRQCGKASKG